MPLEKVPHEPLREPVHVERLFACLLTLLVSWLCLP